MRNFDNLLPLFEEREWRIQSSRERESLDSRPLSSAADSPAGRYAQIRMQRCSQFQNHFESNPCGESLVQLADSDWEIGQHARHSPITFSIIHKNQWVMLMLNRSWTPDWQTRHTCWGKRLFLKTELLRRDYEFRVSTLNFRTLAQSACPACNLLSNCIMLIGFNELQTCAPLVAI